MLVVDGSMIRTAHLLPLRIESRRIPGNRRSPHLNNSLDPFLIPLPRLSVHARLLTNSSTVITDLRNGILRSRVRCLRHLPWYHASIPTHHPHLLQWEQIPPPRRIHILALCLITPRPSYQVS